jgi:hypothetical protein
MRKIDYDTVYDETTGNTGNHIAADEMMKRKNSGLEREGYEEGFASASGVRNETAETGGRVQHPEAKDRSRPDPVSPSIEDENAGLAES